MDEQLVWLPNSNDGYILGKIIDIHTDSATVEIIDNGAKVNVSYSNLLRADDPKRPDVDDNCSLLYLNEGSLLANVKRRYTSDKIYTYVGNILIAINPYKQIGALYDAKNIANYHSKSIGSMPPHVFAIADNAHRQMKMQKMSQAIVVSGESGAGKTECTKHILRYLTANWGTKAGPVEQRILDSNPLLEAFGNAKTRRNNNSSRFGKFIELHFSSSKQVVGAFISHYLLEKSRVCSQSKDERNYHIFYQMCAGITDPKLRNELQLGDPTQFVFLRSGCSKFFKRSNSTGSYLQDDLLDDVADFQRTVKAMQEMGLEKDQDQIFRILAAILHLGNVEFIENDKDTSGGCVVKDPKPVELASKFLGIDKQQLATSLTTREISRLNEKSSVLLNAPAARNARDALAKAVFSSLFDFIAKAVNKSLPFDETSASLFIGVLDIAGFEFFDVNSFEQFCVNYCNERLQQFFTQRVMKAEQDLYEREGLTFRRITFVDNADCIELLEMKPSGIFCLLDEEAKFPTPSSQNFTQQVHSKNKDHYRLSIPRKSKLKAHQKMRDDEAFVVRHYAGAVCYTTEGFIDKNNDALHSSLVALVKTSQNQVLKQMFEKDQIDTNQQPKKLAFVSVSAKFREQLQSLLDKLGDTGTHFVRCVKPNSDMKPLKFEAPSVLSQLQASGMAECLKLMQQGYPSRVNFNEFYGIYKNKLPKSLAKIDPRLFCRALCKAVGMAESDFTFGATKVFFRAGRFAEFDKMLQSDGENLVKLIDSVRLWIVKARWRKCQYFILSAVKTKRRMNYRKQQAIIIQKMVRGFVARRKFRSRIKTMVQLEKLKRQLTVDVSKSISKLKDENKKKTESEMSELMQKLDADKVACSKTDTLHTIDCNRMFKQRSSDVDDFIGVVQKRLEEQNIRDAELERIRKQELEAKKKREKEEAEAKQREEKRRQEEEEAKKIALAAAEAKKQKQREEEDAKMAKSLQEKIDKDNEVELQQKQLQEKLDRELAVRMANGNVDDTIVSVQCDDSSPTTEKPSPKSTTKKHDVTNWKYADLRDTINTSCDIELIDECRQEFHRRLRIYHEWKMKNRGSKETVQSVAQERMPGSVMNHALNQQLKEKHQKIQVQQYNTPITVVDKPNRVAPMPMPSNSGNRQRFFRLPLKQVGANGNSYVAGWWLAHFDGPWIARQLEIRDNNFPVLKLAGVDDMTMCEFNLSETGLESRPDVEIPEQQFDHEWNRNYGTEYVMSNATLISSPYMKMKLQRMMQSGAISNTNLKYSKADFLT